MNLYTTDYHTLSEEDQRTWKELKAETTDFLGGGKIRKATFRKYPKAVRHYDSLFPNNLIDANDLTDAADALNELVADFKILVENSTSTERDILNFIRDKEAYFIIGSILKSDFNFGHHALYLFPEFKMPPNHQADYLLVGKNSDGYHFVFVELENPYGDVTKRDGTYGTTIRKGVKQCEDWDHWLEKYFSNLYPVFEKQKSKTSLLPDEFRSLDKSRIHHVVIAGRRTDFNDRTRRQRRDDQRQRQLHVMHYDKLIDCAEYVIGHPTF